MNDDEAENGIYDVQDILEFSCINGHYYWRVRWVGYHVSEDTWEPIENLSGAALKLQEYWEKVHRPEANKTGETFNEYFKRMKELYKNRVPKTSIHRVRREQKTQEPDIKRFELSTNIFPHRKRFDIEQVYSKAKLFSVMYDIDISVVRKLPHSFFDPENEAIEVLDIKKNSNDCEFNTLINAEKNICIWIPSEVAKKIFPQLVIEYLLNRWRKSST